MKHLLLIDDDAVNLAALELILHDEYSCTTVSDSGRAVTAALERIPDLIICDIEMPGMNGHDVFLEFQKQPLLRHIPFIFLTGKNDHETRRKSMNIGADDFLTKPFTAEEIIEAIRARFERRQILITSITDSIRQTQQQILKVMPHEFRTPLNGILGFSQLLLQFNDESLEGKRRMIASMHRSGLRLLDTTEHFITYFSIINNAVTAVSGKESTVDVIAAAVERRAEAWERLGHFLIEKKLLSFPIYRIHLEMIVKELIDNAFKFSAKDSMVSLTFSDTGSSVGFTITNTGIGFTQDEINAIAPFNQFGREQHEQQGLGLGLFISKYLIELYHGTLSIASERNGDTSVTATFQVR